MILAVVLLLAAAGIAAVVVCDRSGPYRSAAAAAVTDTGTCTTPGCAQGWVKAHPSGERTCPTHTDPDREHTLVRGHR